MDLNSYISQICYSCPSIRDWHSILIEQEGTDIKVANDINEDYRLVEILKPPGNVSELTKIVPNELSRERLKELEFFNTFVLSNHRNYISSNY